MIDLGLEIVLLRDFLSVVYDLVFRFIYGTQ